VTKRRRPMRDGNPRNTHNWKLVCSVCAAEWLDGETIELAAGHFQEAHPDLTEPNFTTVWVGKGPRPRQSPYDTNPGRGNR
jgi:hypothetical protein